MSIRPLQLYRDLVQSGQADSIRSDTVDQLTKMLIDNVKWTPSVCSKSVAECIWSLLVEGTRQSWTSETMRKQLEATAKHSLCDTVVSVFEKNLHLLRSEQHSIRWAYPELVECSWEVGRIIESSDMGMISVPCVSLNLKSIPPGQLKSEKVELTCNQLEFQDLHWKVKEAQNALRQLKKK